MYLSSFQISQIKVFFVGMLPKKASACSSCVCVEAAVPTLMKINDADEKEGQQERVGSSICLLPVSSL